MSEVHITRGYTPGSIGRIAQLHGVYYHRQWNFGLFFEAKVATELSAFLAGYDQRRDSFWTAQLSGHVEGSIAIDGLHAQEEGAHLRWFIVSDALRGKGVGNQLIETAVDFCRAQEYRRIYLWTFAGLDAARRLYEKAGFSLVEQRPGDQWGTPVDEQQFALQLTSP
ncbi:MAG: GNAT family N-acetyltransferase [Candidatus Latescibacteria bacterium]|nr:GNAT family N-acetyltransferase [Candidatus Latescibacterota bacterium]